MESVSGVKGLTMKMPNNDQDKIFSQSLEKGRVGWERYFISAISFIPCNKQS